MRFQNREDAGERLAGALDRWRGARPLVVAIPRGAVPMGAVIARRLQGDLDVVLVRKLKAPYNPEYALGAVDESGWTFVLRDAALAGATPDYLEAERQRELQTIRARRACYTPGRSAIEVRGRVVIVVDDGLATGATMMAALHALRARSPQRLICAVPVSSRAALALVGAHADEVVCLDAPDDFHAVGQAYDDFAQVSDAEVIDVLRGYGAPPEGPAKSARDRAALI